MKEYVLKNSNDIIDDKNHINIILIKFKISSL